MKAILVIDMPSNCYECDYCGYAIIDSNEGNEYKYRSCALSQRYLGEIEENCKDSLCPLKPMPQELPSPYMMRQIQIAEGIQTEKPPYTEEYQKGYNDCINDILGGTEWHKHYLI